MGVDKCNNTYYILYISNEGYTNEDKKMRYQKTVEMTTETILALENGTMNIQCGQWVRFGSTLSRYVGRTSAGSLWIVHSTRPDQTIFNMGKFQRMNKRYKKLINKC